MEEVLQDILADLDPYNGPDAAEVIALLEQYGYMIVPIEDPTNLRFGVE